MLLFSLGLAAPQVTMPSVSIASITPTHVTQWFAMLRTIETPDQEVTYEAPEFPTSHQHPKYAPTHEIIPSEGNSEVG